jgi:hypothetical protein
MNMQKYIYVLIYYNFYIIVLCGIRLERGGAFRIPNVSRGEHWILHY